MNRNSSILSSRNPGIDLLRGISIVLVVMHHVGLRIPLKNGVLATFIPVRYLNTLIYNGYEAVFIFFVISGFLITTNSLTRWGSLPQIDAKNFYIRRGARILPTLLLLVSVLSMLHIAGVKYYTITHSNQSLLHALFSALSFHLNWYEGLTRYLPGNWDVLWSLSIEEVFYICFPLVCIFIRRDWILLVLLFLFAISLPYTRGALAGNEIWQEKAYLPGMAGISMGVLGALMANRAGIPKEWIVLLFKVSGIAGIISVLCFEDILWPLIGNGAILLLTFSTICLILSFHWEALQGKLRIIPGTGWLCSFGRLSYEVYLTHMFIVFTVVNFFKTNSIGIWWGILWYVPALLFSWLLGWLVSDYISVPSEKAIRKMMTLPNSNKQVRR